MTPNVNGVRSLFDQADTNSCSYHSRFVLVLFRYHDQHGSIIIYTTLKTSLNARPICLIISPNTIERPNCSKASLLHWRVKLAAAKHASTFAVTLRPLLEVSTRACRAQYANVAKLPDIRSPCPPHRRTDPSAVHLTVEVPSDIRSLAPLRRIVECSVFANFTILTSSLSPGSPRTTDAYRLSNSRLLGVSMACL